MMKRYILHIVISAVSLIIALGHTIFPGIRIDVITLVLFLIAVLPWLGFIFKSVEFPGGLKVEYPALEKASEDAAKAGLLSAPPKKERGAAYLEVVEDDPNLALAGLRIEIERRLREIARAHNLNEARTGIRQLLQLLKGRSLISNEEGSVLDELTTLLSKAVHGAEVDSRAVHWAIDIGPQILSALDEKISGAGN